MVGGLENALNHGVGVILTSSGTFFAGEVLGVELENGDLVLLPMIAG